jgi:beta-phosphoglucomutase-like phosphatase (HAD superfamily)
LGAVKAGCSILFANGAASHASLPGECVMIDDSPDKLKSARAYGYSVIQYTPGVSIPAELLKIGVEVNL